MLIQHKKISLALATLLLLPACARIDRLGAAPTVETEAIEVSSADAVTQALGTAEHVAYKGYLQYPSGKTGTIQVDPNGIVVVQNLYVDPDGPQTLDEGTELPTDSELTWQQAGDLAQVLFNASGCTGVGDDTWSVTYFPPQTAPRPYYRAQRSWSGGRGEFTCELDSTTGAVLNMRNTLPQVDLYWDDWYADLGQERRVIACDPDRLTEAELQAVNARYAAAVQSANDWAANDAEAMVRAFAQQGGLNVDTLEFYPDTAPWPDQYQDAFDAPWEAHQRSVTLVDKAGGHWNVKLDTMARRMVSVYRLTTGMYSAHYKYDAVTDTWGWEMVKVDLEEDTPTGYYEQDAATGAWSWVEMPELVEAEATPAPELPDGYYEQDATTGAWNWVTILNAADETPAPESAAQGD